ncbi:SDR family oxidoreductase [Pseudenhygromyxa sp. WMMC2535]|uniref:SDR family oxidoreductase n=1 Tax=Pseudenhygromyxa sp. WMMC2535 TaxID=2712867 RepID=UPI001551E065|nr:SDR family oxidoreductase [Pseudenhygromyxa sp. WMMC2535]NVB42915.1 SDR family oxidoreductase [Pseudenhygromyxa sp. WMMC2535]
MDLKLKDKVVMVAAASRGLGYGVAMACAREGAKVSIASRGRAAIDEAARSIREATGAQVGAYTFDAGEADSISDWVERTRADLGPVDGLLINAGGPPSGNFVDFGDEDWQAAFELTLMSAVRMIRAVLPDMLDRGGSVLTVTSSSVKEPIDVILLSNVMRSGVTALIKSLSLEYADRNVRFNNLMPGLIDTDRVASLNQVRAEQTGTTPEQVRQRQEAALPMKRYGRPDEFGRAAAFLLSDAAGYITGVSLAVDGGKMKTVW